MAEVFVRRLTRWQADQQREAIADLYVHAYDGAPGQESADRTTFLRRFEEDIQRPGFDMLIASGGTFLAGCVYGYPQQIEELGTHSQVFAVVELMVLPDLRRTHIASRLQERLLIRVDAELVATLIAPENTAAMAAYASWGWTKSGRTTTANSRTDMEIWSRSTR